MSKTLKIAKYGLAHLRGQTYFCFSIILLNIILSFIVLRFIAGDTLIISSIGSTDLIALGWIFVIGISCFESNFKYLLSYGVSRKMFFRAITLSYIMLAAIWALGVTVSVIVAAEMARIFVLYQAMYRSLEVISVFTWSFAALLLLLMLGWFIALVYYRSDKRTKYIVGLAPFVIFGLLSVINQVAGGVISRAVFAVLTAAMGFSTPVPNPYIAALSMLLGAAFLCGCNFLLIRKAQLRY